MMGGWWVFGVLMMVVCIYMMSRMMMGHGASGHAEHNGRNDRQGTSSATEILAERFARGEISEEEFEQRKRALEGSPH